MDFGEVLTKAWKIVWKFKILWVFGIFAACGTRNGGGFNGGGGSSYRSNGTPGQIPNLPPGFEDNLLKFVRFFENPAVIAGFISLICVIILLTIFFSIVGRIGLIKGAVGADAGAEHLSFGELWKSGLQYFWRFLGLSLLIGSPILLFYLALVIGGLFILLTYLSGSQNSSFSAAAPAIVALIPVICLLVCAIFLFAIIISFLRPQAERAIVIENEGILSSLRRGWNVLTKNLGPILIIWFITVVIGFAVGILVALPVFIILVPAFIAFMAGGNNPSFTPLVIAGLCIVAYIPVSLVANGILTAYLESVWTLTYLRLTKLKPDAQVAIVPQNA
jgi:hypothetical protein